MKIDNLKEKIKNHLKNNPSKIAPIISGATALYFIERVIFSNLPLDKFITALLIILIIFIISACLYWKLKIAEQDKDKYVLSTVGKIVEDVFKQYGVAMANNNASVTASQMNPIMQTIVNLLDKLKQLMNKDYTK